MTETKEILLTRIGMNALKSGLDYLKTEKRSEITEKIKTARGFGDLSENAEYDEAKNEQAEVEAEIAKLEEMLKFARVVDDEDVRDDVVTIGKKVTVEMFGTQTQYTIVGSSEVDPYKNKLSYESPVGAAMMNHAEGETVQAATPGGIVDIKIIAVEK